MTQPLDDGIIANCKVKYKNKLLRLVCSSSRVEGKKNASEIVKSVNVSTAIERGKKAGDEVSTDLIVKCFKKTKLYPRMIRLRARMNCLPYNSWYTRSTPRATP